MRGPECSAALLTLQSPGQKQRSLTVVRYQVAAPAPVYSRLLKNTGGSRIGYIFLSSFLDVTIPERIKQALSDFGQLDGLIIDNRMNAGGSSRVLLPVLGIFTAGDAGNLVSRAGSRLLKVKSDPVGESQKLPLVVLVSGDTVSYGEVFAGILQDLHRASVVGTATAGRVETLRGYNFLDGSRAWIAQESFQTINSHTGWRKSGVKPDVEIAGDWDTFTFETDPAVAAALKLFRTK
jgi:carboxyl-terminal processing protease